MVVCKFFQQGSCRFGQNCKFEHVYSSKYSYHAPIQSQQPVTVTDEQLVHQVQSDIQAVLKGGQWILSGYAPFKEKAAIPGLTDLSPEEARLFIYEAKANNTVDQAISYINTLSQEMKSKYEQLLQPSPSMVKILRSLYQGEIVTSPFMSHQPSGFSANAAASSIFRSAVQSAPQTSIFGQNTQNSSPFGQITQNSSSFGQSVQNTSPISEISQSSVFGQSNVFGQSADPAKSLFAQASQNISSPTSQNIFGQTQATGTSIFASPLQQNAASFWSQQTAQTQPELPSNTFQSSVFQQPEKPTNVFGQAKNIFQQTVDDPGMYSKLEELCAEDIEMFKSDKFKLGFIPELPPPHELCI